MSYLSDPDRLERIAVYVQDDPPNALPHEVALVLNDAAARIRSLQERLTDALRRLGEAPAGGTVPAEPPAGVVHLRRSVSSVEYEEDAVCGQPIERSWLSVLPLWSPFPRDVTCKACVDGMTPAELGMWRPAPADPPEAQP